MNGKIWRNDTKFVKIESVVPVPSGEPSLVIKTNAFENGNMPLDWKDMVPIKDTKAVEILFESVENWALKNGYSS